MNLTILNNINFCEKRKINETNRRKQMPTEKPIETVNDVEYAFSKKAIKLMKALVYEIENTWGDIKKGKLLKSSPVFLTSNKHDGSITIKPIYGGLKPEILMEMTNDKFTQRFIFNRKNPEEFRYEKIITTDFGTATVKTFNSVAQKDLSMIALADEKICAYFPRLISHQIKEEFFGKKVGNTKPRIKIVL